MKYRTFAIIFALIAIFAAFSCKSVKKIPKDVNLSAFSSQGLQNNGDYVAEIESTATDTNRNSTLIGSVTITGATFKSNLDPDELNNMISFTEDTTNGNSKFTTSPTAIVTIDDTRTIMNISISFTGERASTDDIIKKGTINIDIPKNNLNIKEDYIIPADGLSQKIKYEITYKHLEEEEVIIEIEKVELFDFATPLTSDSTIEMLVGDTLKIKSNIVISENSTIHNGGTFSSTDGAIVDFNNDTGLIEAKAVGNVTITFKSNDDETKTASFNVSVKKNYEKEGCIAFVSKNKFSLKTDSGKSHWFELRNDNTFHGRPSYFEDDFDKDGNNIMQYSTSAESTSWNEWDGSEIESSAEADEDGNFYLYIRGKDNAIVSAGYNTDQGRWVFKSKDASISDDDLRIECYGDIRNLLNYENVDSANIGYESKNEYGCFYALFFRCTQLTRAPKLPSTNLNNKCYYYMFQYCSNLELPPDLPSDVLKDRCYEGMFASSGVKTSARMGSKDTRMAESSCLEMYGDCPNLQYLRALPSTALDYECYFRMFTSCEELKQLPFLPAQNLPGKYVTEDLYELGGCYENMFSYCTSIKLEEGAEPSDDLPYIFTINNEGETGNGAMENMFSGIGNPKVNVDIERGKTYRTNCEIVYPENI